MTKQALLEEILQLSVEERIELVGEVWDSIAANPDDVPVPEWHRAELAKRLANHDGELVPWEEVRDPLKEDG